MLAKRGFGFGEVLLLVAVLAALASAFVIKKQLIDKAKARRVKADFVRILDAIDRYHAMKHAWPERISDLVAAGELDAPVPRDPWGNEYGYDRPFHGQGPVLVSYGLDGAPGGLGECQDLTTYNIDLILGAW